MNHESSRIVIECLDCGKLMLGASSERQLLSDWNNYQCSHCMSMSSLEPLIEDDGSYKRFSESSSSHQPPTTPKAE